MALTAARLRELLDYDPETGVFKVRTKWHRNVVVGREWGTLEPKTRYVRLSIFGQRYFAHRLAWLHVYGEWPKNQIDHINATKNDNRICNLREATPSQNAGNRVMQLAGGRCNTTGFKGIWRHNSARHPWVAEIRVSGTKHYLGAFETREQAHAAYCEAAVRFHGEFARV